MSTVDESIPILDLAPYLAGEPGADVRLAAELRRACEEIGFYFIVNHGVPTRLIEAAFAERTGRSEREPRTSSPRFRRFG
jgi:isopenicillin N synthase-like dioxygenase